MFFNLAFNFIDDGLLVRFDKVDPYSIDDSVEEGPEVHKVEGDVVVLEWESDVGYDNTIFSSTTKPKHRLKIIEITPTTTN